jgi:NADH dehydrogenase FAD-containing subunit
VVASSGLLDDGWIPIEKTTLKTRFPGIYALGDVAGTPNPKAGVFAETAARVAADDIVAALHDGELERLVGPSRELAADKKEFASSRARALVRLLTQDAGLRALTTTETATASCLSPGINLFISAIRSSGKRG